MKKYGIKVAACAIAGTLSLTGYQSSLEAKINNSSNVPAAGVAVVLDECSTIQDLQVEVVENIAYLESASGLQPNIVLASERAAQSETTVDNPEQNENDVATNTEENIEEAAEQKETTTQQNTEETTTDAPVEESSETKETETAQGTNSETETEGTEETSAARETESVEETTSETETEGAEETESTSETEDDFNTSAGFSAIETYDKVVVETETAQETEIETETQEDAQDFSGLVIARVTNYVNVRSIPSEEGEIVGKLYDKSVGEFIEEKDGWYKITSGNCTGYVKGEYCVVGEEAEALAKEVGTTFAIVNTTTLKVRQEASTESSVLGLVPIEEELVVVEELDGWVKIAIEEGDGYVSREYVNLRTDFVRAESREEEEARLAKEAQEREQARAAAAAATAARAERQAETQTKKSESNQAVITAAQNTAASSEGSAMGKAVIDYATQFVGNPYVYGGSSLTNGTDCSGFVMSVYNNFGVSLPHSSSAMRSRGYDVGGLANAQPGDIVCYSGHVGLYVGNGQIVHASTQKIEAGGSLSSRLTWCTDQPNNQSFRVDNKVIHLFKYYKQSLISASYS